MKTTYEQFDLPEFARRGMNYITSMVDEQRGFLPYWYVQINENPAYARHVRVDDAELVASWYEAISATERIIGESERSRAVKAGFREHLLRSYGPRGLRYSEPYPWTHSINASFHEQGWVLAGLNQLLRDDPACAEAERAAAGVVRGMRELVDEKTTLTFWSGDSRVPRPTYEFPHDVYMAEGGWVSSRLTGRGDLPARNNVVLEPLAARSLLCGDKVATDLAVGLANQMLDYSRYFTWDMTYHGHVHSTVWCAIGLLKLGRLLGDERYIDKALGVFEFTLSKSSSFGWVPEYIGWRPPSEEHCETCCIKDMIEFALDACDMGMDYWEVVDRFTRNQLVEQQIQDGGFVGVDNGIPNTDERTYRDMDKRIVGGWSGGALPNSISLAKFRSIAGCCVGTAPVALWRVWEAIVQERGGVTYINLPMNRDADSAKVEIGYPNEGWLRITVKRPGTFRVRPFKWMGDHVEVRLNGQVVPPAWADRCLHFESLRPGDVVELVHPLRREVRVETVAGLEYQVEWLGSDVVSLNPPGMPLRLYQRVANAPKSYPKPPGAKVAEAQLGPTQQK